MYKLICAVMALALLASCTSEQSSVRKKAVSRKSQPVFVKLKDYSLQLTLLTAKRDFYAGDANMILTFALKNTGVKPVTLYEWHTLEAANIHLYYRPGKADDPANVALWKQSRTYDPKARNLQKRSPLSLNPGSNQAIIQVPMDFLKDIRNPRGIKKPYTLKAVLNLYTVTVESEPIQIYIK